MELKIKCPDCGRMLKVTVEEAEETCVNVVRKSSMKMTWQEISDVIKKGKAEELFALGDEIACTLQDGTEVVWQVAAFSPYPQYGNTVALVMKDCIEEAWEMNEECEYGSAGGWNTCLMRTRLEECVYPKLPEDMKAVIVPREIAQYLDGSKEEYDPVVTKDAKLWLLSAKEVFDIDSQCDADDVHFPFFSDERSRVKQYGSETAYWWLRSPYPSYTNLVRLVYTDGSLYNYIAYNSYGVAAACLIG